MRVQERFEALEPFLEAAEVDYTKRRTKRARLDSYAINVETFKRYAEEHGACDTCGRPFTDNEKQSFLRRQVTMC